MAITATMAEAQNDYYKAMRAGKREGETLPNLDDILKEKNIVAVREVPLGLVQIPSELIVGTKTAGRSSAFSKGFKPLLKENTEFAYKWMALYKAHLNEGIREPIKAYEFMNKFYVEEGNKRVSVLKFFDAVSIPGNVTVSFPRERKKKKIKFIMSSWTFTPCLVSTISGSPNWEALPNCSVSLANARMKHGAMTTDWILHLLTTVSVPNTRQMAVIKSRLLPVMRSFILSVCMTTVHSTI